MFRFKALDTQPYAMHKGATAEAFADASLDLKNKNNIPQPHHRGSIRSSVVEDLRSEELLIRTRSMVNTSKIHR